VNILWEDKNQPLFKWFFYFNEISVAVTVKLKETKKKKKKAGSKERLLLALILFICFASMPNSTSHEATPHYMKHCAITKGKDRVCSK